MGLFNIFKKEKSDDRQEVNDIFRKSYQLFQNGRLEELLDSLADLNGFERLLIHRDCFINNRCISAYSNKTIKSVINSFNNDRMRLQTAYGEIIESLKQAELEMNRHYKNKNYEKMLEEILLINLPEKRAAKLNYLPMLCAVYFYEEKAFDSISTILGGYLNTTIEADGTTYTVKHVDYLLGEMMCRKKDGENLKNIFREELAATAMVYMKTPDHGPDMCRVLREMLIYLQEPELAEMVNEVIAGTFEQRIKEADRVKSEKAFMDSLSYDEYMDIYGDSEELREMNAQRLAENAQVKRAAEAEEAQREAQKKRVGYSHYNAENGTLYNFETGEMTYVNKEKGTAYNMDSGEMTYINKDSGTAYNMDSGEMTYINKEKGTAYNMDTGAMSYIDEESGDIIKI